MTLRWTLLSVSVPVSILLVVVLNSPAHSDTGPAFGIDKRVPFTTSRLIGSPDPPPKYRLTRAFKQVTFKEPVFIAQDPTSDRADFYRDPEHAETRPRALLGQNQSASEFPPP